MGQSKTRTEQAIKSVTQEFKAHIKKYAAARKIMLGKKISKIEFLEVENVRIESNNCELKKKLNSCKQVLDDSKIKNNKLTLQLSTFEEQLEKCKIDGRTMTIRLKDVQEENPQHEIENNK